MFSVNVKRVKVHKHTFHMKKKLLFKTHFLLRLVGTVRITNSLFPFIATDRKKLKTPDYYPQPAKGPIYVSSSCQSSDDFIGGLVIAGPLNTV